jgi:hypothetical protein
MENGINVWMRCDENGKEIERVKSEKRPDGNNDWFPAYPHSRIHGIKYSYYSGDSDWVRAANKSMAINANYNFRKSRMR